MTEKNAESPELDVEAVEAQAKKDNLNSTATVLSKCFGWADPIEEEQAKEGENP